MKSDLSHLLGVEIIYHNDGLDYNGFCAGIDPLKGITIKSLDTQEDLYCLNALSPKYVRDPDKYMRRFIMVQTFLEAKLWDTEWDSIEYADEFGFPSKYSQCAFK